MNTLRTTMLLAALTALFMGLGYLIGGLAGALIAFVIAAGMNLFTYWNADKIVLRMHNAQEVDARSCPQLFGIVEELARRGGLPTPRVYLIDEPHPNAFATGRNPQNAAVAATEAVTNALRTSSPTSNARGPIAGPNQANSSSPGTPIALIVASNTPSSSPRQPACTAATTVPASSHSNTGRQSAVMTVQPTPACRENAASASGGKAGDRYSAALITRVPCTCRSHTGSLLT